MQSPPRPRRWNRSWTGALAVALVVIAGLVAYVVDAGHPRHVLDAWPYLAIAAFFVLHLVMHGSHGSHGGHGAGHKGHQPSERERQ